MVQPSVCVDGKWRPIGKIDESTDATVREVVANLWEKRKRIIFRDNNLDLDELIPSADILMSGNKKESTQPVYEEFRGEGSSDEEEEEEKHVDFHEEEEEEKDEYLHEEEDYEENEFSTASYYGSNSGSNNDSKEDEIDPPELTESKRKVIFSENASE